MSKTKINPSTKRAKCDCKAAHRYHAVTFGALGPGQSPYTEAIGDQCKYCTYYVVWEASRRYNFPMEYYEYLEYSVQYGLGDGNKWIRTGLGDDFDEDTDI